jgi:outer membrane protein assembly factor BamB
MGNYPARSRLFTILDQLFNAGHCQKITAKDPEMRIWLLFCFLSLFGLAPAVRAENWGHWRGEAGNGVSTTAKPPIEWSRSKNIKWSLPIPGRGSGSPVVWGDKVFVTSAVPTGKKSSGSAAELDFKLMCVDRANGKLLWELTSITATPHQETHPTNPYASASPCTDGQHVYAHFGSRGLYCYTLDGKLVWKRDDFGKMQTRNGFGEGSSPVLEGDMLLLPWDHEGPSALYALDKRTGKTIWKADRDEPTCWATPLVVEHAGKKQIVMNGQTCARSYDLQTGKEQWRCAGQTERPCASAVAGQGLIFVGSGHRGSFLGAFRPDSSGDIQGSSKVAWTITRDTPDIASPLLSGSRLYFHKGKTGQLSCVNATDGRPFYMASRIPGIDSTYASPIAAGGFVYLTGRDGTTAVIKDSDQLEIVSTNELGEGVDSTPAPVDDQLFIRGEKHLFCIDQP